MELIHKEQALDIQKAWEKTCPAFPSNKETSTSFEYEMLPNW